jgi:hypothetical protein
MIVPQPGRRDWDHCKGMRRAEEKEKGTTYHATIRSDAREQNYHAIRANVDFRVRFTHRQRVNGFSQEFLSQQVIACTISAPLHPLYSEYMITHLPKTAQTTAQSQSHLRAAHSASAHSQTNTDTSSLLHTPAYP